MRGLVRLRGAGIGKPRVTGLDERPVMGALVPVMIRNGLRDAGGHVRAVRVGVRDMRRQSFGPFHQDGLGILHRRHRADDLSGKLGIGRLRFRSLAHIMLPASAA